MNALPASKQGSKVAELAQKLQKIASALTEQGVPTKTGKSNRWSHQAVARILRRQ